jgi:hypothetical protein
MHKEFESTILGCPPDTTRLWRYMTLSRFLFLVKEGKLYFSKLAEFTDDPYEGTLPKGQTGEIDENQKLGYGLAPSLAAVSCWHENDYESVAMWKLYVPGPEGVAIQTTVAKLKQLDEQSPFAIGRVKYLDYEKESQPNSPAYPLPAPYGIVLQKRRSYEHEREVRVVIFNPADIPYQTSVPTERCSGTVGFGVPVRLADLIDRIVVSPEFPPWAISPLRQIVGAAGLTTEIEQSDLLKPPNRESAERLEALVEKIKPMPRQSAIQLTQNLSSTAVKR